ncbi:MAG TPA: Rieske (2Fe-2S) protein [Acidimicrobiales bacterium]|jgi:thiosulfate dehydrogenase [quinone] large subunit|nr:Rieske (2Fe-2S) protein [Acidimicrobiales bacterium]
MAGWALLPLRAFLGVTFVFAGLQKLANPGFFNASNPASIQAQLTAAQRISPIHGVLGPISHVSVLVGLVIAFGEVAIGLGTLLGFLARAAAAGGLILSLLLFLTVSYHSHPYYTGSDIVFVFAWMPLVIAGAGGVLSADGVLAHRVRAGMGAEPQAVTPVDFAVVRRVCGQFEDGRCEARNGQPCAPGPCPFLAQQPPRARRIDQNELDRRTLLATGGAAAALSAVVLVGGGLVAGLGRLFGGSSGGPSTPALGAATSTAGSTAASSTTTPAADTPSTTTSTAAPSTPSGTKIGPAKDVPVGGAASFQDPSSGDPSLVVQPVAGTYLAFDAVCPHAGCTVDYSSTSRLFVCPCHGSEFNGRTGAVEVGPAQSGLTQLRIAEGSDGQLYVS